MTKTPSASATPYTCSNEKSFWIPVEYTPKICTSYCACQNFIFFFKITFVKHPSEGVVSMAGAEVAREAKVYERQGNSSFYSR